MGGAAKSGPHAHVQVCTARARGIRSHESRRTKPGDPVPWRRDTLLSGSWQTKGEPGEKVFYLETQQDTRTDGRGGGGKVETAVPRGRPGVSYSGRLPCGPAALQLGFGGGTSPGDSGARPRCPSHPIHRDSLRQACFPGVSEPLRRHNLESAW